LLSDVPKICICSPAQAAALEIWGLGQSPLTSCDLQNVFRLASVFLKPALPPAPPGSWASGFVAVFFCFSGVFLRLNPPLVGSLRTMESYLLVGGMVWGRRGHGGGSRGLGTWEGAAAIPRNTGVRRGEAAVAVEAGGGGYLPDAHAKLRAGFARRQGVYRLD
jgi:hypothetical protein